MLTSDQLDTLVEPIMDVYEEFSQTIINDIARRLTKLGGKTVSEMAAWQTQRLIESGKVYENVIKELSKLTHISKQTLKDMFQKAGVKATSFDNKIYEAAGLKPIPLNLSPAMVQTLLSGLKKTNAIVDNMTLTTALSAQQSFIHNADIAYLQVTSGTLSYDDAIRQAVIKSADDGLSVIQYGTGHVDQLDVAMRRTVLTGVSQTAAKVQEQHADEMGSDLVQVSAHIGARPTHQVWQGKIYSRSGKHSKFPDFVSSTGYGTGPGLCGWNCRHSFWPFFEGLSQEAYKGVELESFKRKMVKVNGLKETIYDAKQIQRSIERKIREWKRRAQALDAAGLDNSQETARVKMWQARMRQLINSTNFQREYIREQV